MHYPIAIETGTGTEAYGVVVPDLRGCFSAGDTLDEAMDNAKEAIELWLEVAIDDGMAIPEPSLLADHQRKREFKGWTWALITVDLASLSDKTERINITLPSRVLRRIDQAAKDAGESRSGYIARRALA
jgi:predicted RNase H-like HicB family nuclease